MKKNKQKTSPSKKHCAVKNAYVKSAVKSAKNAAKHLSAPKIKNKPADSSSIKKHAKPACEPEVPNKITKIPAAGVKEKDREKENALLDFFKPVKSFLRKTCVIPHLIRLWAIKRTSAAKAEKKIDAHLEIKQRVLSLNPVFVKFIAFVPLLGGATSFKNGILLSCAMIINVVLLNLLLIPVYKFIPAKYRAAVLFALSGIVITPVYAAAKYLVPSVAAGCGIYLPLIAVFAPVLTERKYFGKPRGIMKTAFCAFFNGIGFAAATLLFSFAREIITNGSVYDRPLPYLASIKFKFAAYPAGAFILLAAFAALFRKISGYKGDERDGEK